MEPIKDAVELVIRNLTAKKTAGSVLDPQVWLKKALTKKELGHIKFHYFRNGVLGVRVDSSVWMYVLNLKKTETLLKIRRMHPEVRELHFSIGDVR